jgi:hypothetical protein
MSQHYDVIVIGGDAERQDKGRSEGKAGRTAHLAQGESQVLQ